MTNPQGTEWETEFVNRAQERGLMAARIPEGGSRDLGDVWLNHPPHFRTAETLIAVAWKRLTGEGSRRTPDGERDVVILSTDDFHRLVFNAGEAGWEPGWIIENKWQQTLNVTRALAKAREKAAG